MLSLRDRPHVLAYDDDRAIRDVYRELLTEEGYSVTPAPAPLSNLDEVVTLQPDVVIVELMAGREEIGSGFLASLKAHPDTVDLPVLVCSGDAPRLERMRRWLDDWACAVIEKPFDIDDFLAAVRSCLGDTEGRDEPQDAA